MRSRILCSPSVWLVSPLPTSFGMMAGASCSAFPVDRHVDYEHLVSYFLDLPGYER